MTTQDVRAHLDSLAKPPASLGRLEDLAARLCVIQRALAPRTTPRRVVLFAADHGVVAEGVTAWPAEVTRAMVRTIADGRAAGSVLAAATGTELHLVDVGVTGPVRPDGGAFFHRRVRDGSRNLAVEPALTRDEFRAAVRVGEEFADRAAGDGMIVVAAGEMGIGNSTPASCLTALLAGISAADAVGPGAGANAATVDRKRRVVAAKVAIERHSLADDPEATIASMGGLEIAAMAGFYRRAAAAGLTVVLDGFIATAAALVAERLWPGTAEAMIAAHRSAEPGHAAALRHLGLVPFLDGWQLRLGEGTGAILLMPLLDAAAALCRMATLADVLGGRPE
jgi:nicotinate-nucleotide--dimethylbenzimidazole phosphoribosyltransferase